MGIRIFWLLLATFLIQKAQAQSSDRFTTELPFPRAIYHKVEFWKRIYTEVDSNEGILHDADDLSIRYENVDVSGPRGNKRVSERRNRIREHLFNILRKKGQNLTVKEREILSKFPQYASRSRLLQATENIRFQRGQADRFRQGVVNSGQYMPHIEQVVEELDLPDFLKYLPHVESSFQKMAISKYGAAGMWQLMPNTGRQFLKVGYAVDERFDPWEATRAGLQYLKRNYKELKSWPLTLMSYNHGIAGVRRAIKILGTRDIEKIIFRYSSPSFGFASRNFYPQFLAAVEVAENYQRYFGSLDIAEPKEFEVVQLTTNTPFGEFAKDYRFSREEFKELNPALRPVVLRNERAIPAKTKVRVPKNSHAPNFQVASIDTKSVSESSRAAIESQVQEQVSEIVTTAEPEEEPEFLKRFERSNYKVKNLEEGKGWVKVQVNETIAQLAEWLNVGVDELRAWNGMEGAAQVRFGQRVLVQFKEVEPESFEQVRTDYHAKIREDFFSQFGVQRVKDYEVKAGENLWSICYQKFDIPPWLLEEFNPDTSLWDLSGGTKIKIPLIEENIPAFSEAEAEQTN